MLARRKLRQLALAALQRLDGVFVESPGDWDSQPVNFPEVKLRCGPDRKSAIAKTLPEFNTTVTLEIVGRVKALTAEDAQDALEDLGSRIENAVLGEPALIGMCQQVPSVTTHSTVSADGEVHIAGLHITIDCETFEFFDPTEIHPTWYPVAETLAVNVVTQLWSSPDTCSDGDDDVNRQIQLDALAAAAAASQAAASAAAASAAAATAAAGSPAPAPQVITGPSVTAMNRGYYVLASTTDATHVLLSAAPADGDTVTLDVATSLYPVVVCNGNPLLGVVEDLTLDRRVCITLRFVSNLGWRLI